LGDLKPFFFPKQCILNIKQLRFPIEIMNFRISFSTFLCIIIGLLFLRCTGSSNNKLKTVIISDFPISDLKLSDFSKSVELIPLETKPEGLIMEIIDLQIYDGIIFILDLNSRLLAFNRKGKFISRIGTEGEGPGEYKYVRSFTINPTSGMIYLATNRGLLIFSKEFQFLEEHLTLKSLDYITIVENGLWAISQSYEKPVKNGFANETYLHFLNLKFQSQDSVLFRTIILKNKTAASYPFKNFISNREESYFLFTPVMTNEKFIRDTLYQVVNRKLIPHRKLEFGLPHFNEKGNKNVWIYNIFVCGSYLFCEYSQNTKKMFFLFNEDKSIGYNLEEGLLDENANPLKLHPLRNTLDQLYFVKKSSFSETAIEEQNPVIGIVTLK
jgi:hypothetical protein